MRTLLIASEEAYDELYKALIHVGCVIEVTIRTPDDLGTLYGGTYDIAVVHVYDGDVPTASEASGLDAIRRIAESCKCPILAITASDRLESAAIVAGADWFQTIGEIDLCPSQFLGSQIDHAKRFHARKHAA